MNEREELDKIIKAGYRIPAPTLTPAEKAKAWVEWWCNEDADSVGVYADVLGWKELATRQARGETIDELCAQHGVKTTRRM